MFFLIHFQLYQKKTLTLSINFNVLNSTTMTEEKKPILKGDFKLYPKENRLFNPVDIGKAQLMSNIREELLKRHRIKEISEDDFQKELYETTIYCRQTSPFFNYEALDKIINQINQLRENGYFISKIQLTDIFLIPQLYRFTGDLKMLEISTQQQMIYISLPSLHKFHSENDQLKRIGSDWLSYLKKDERRYEHILDNYEINFSTENNYLMVNVFNVVR